MLPQIFEPYRREEGTWDTWAHIALTAAVSGKTGEALVIGVIIVIIAGLIWANAYLLHTMGKYLWYVYTTRAWGNDKASRALQAISIGTIVVWVLSYAFYKEGRIDYALHFDIIGVSFLLFALGITQAEKRQARKELGTAAPSNVPGISGWLKGKKEN